MITSKLLEDIENEKIDKKKIIDSIPGMMETLKEKHRIEINQISQKL